ncbi:PQQ-binding-like beta-propeller repeat protein [Nibrella saemangeumensis]|uniref:PQQ-binding-like beta-propeller repeat protein n=1 Tax=Nibrella saemangeumensis TaxID=1084526 RepID=A0ABP8NU05_9BACT
MITHPPAESPFKFLDAYTAQDKDRFFGRDAEQKRLVELLFRSRLILVYGQSGTGKTSLVQCGLAKALSASDYFPILVRRRGHILTSLQTTLTGILDEDDTTDVVTSLDRLGLYAMRPVYLIFDQLEELFVSGSSDEQHQFFEVLRRIYQVSSGCKLLLVMREDYIAYLYPYEEILPELFDFRLRIEPMSERALQEVITGTCQQTDRIRLLDEKETVRQIIRNNQGAGHPFQLPYLQVYLDRLWRTAQATQPGETVVFDPVLVEQVGAIDDVLEQFLNEQLLAVSADLPMIDTPTVRRVLEAFVTYEGTRREHRIPSLAAETGLEPSLLSLLLSQLDRSRILSGDDGLYELAHDSLAKLIDRGRSAEQRQLNDIIRRLREAYSEFMEKGQAPDLLLPARRLSEIQLYPDAIHAELARLVPNSEAIWQYVSDSQKELHRRQRKEIKRLRTTIGIVSGLFLLALVAAFLAVREWEKSNVKSVVLQLTDMDPLSAQVMSIWAHEKEPTPTSAGALYNSFYNQRLFEAVLDKGPTRTAEFSPDGQFVVSVTDHHQIQVWDWQRQRIIDSLNLPEPVRSVSVAPLADPVVVVTESGGLWVWNRRNRQPVSIAKGFRVRGAGMSPDGTIIIAVTDDQVHRWVRRPTGWTDLGGIPARSAGFAPDGKTMLTLTADGIATLWNTATWQPLRRVMAGAGFESEAISPNARQVLLTTKDSKVYLLDALTGRQRLLAQAGPALGSGFAPDGQTLWTATEDSLHLWPASGTASLPSLKLLAPFRSISLSPDGQTILVMYQNNAGHLLNREGVRLDYLSHNSPVRAALFAADGKHILTTAEDGNAYVWGQNDRRFSKLETNGRPLNLERSRDGRQVLQVTNQGIVQTRTGAKPAWDSLTGRLPVRWATFLPDGQQILAISKQDGKTSQWHVRTKRITRTLAIPPARFIEISQNGGRLLSVLESGELWLGRPDGTGRQAVTIPSPVQTAHFSANGDAIVVTGENACYVLNRQGTITDSLVTQEPIRSAEFSPDGKAVVIATLQPKVYLWTPVTNAVVIMNDQAVVKTAIFCDGGRLVLTLTTRGNVTFWSTDGQAIARINESYTEVWPSPSGRQLLFQNRTHVLFAPDPGAIDSWYRQTFPTDEINKMTQEAAKKYSITTSLWQALMSNSKHQ